VFKLDTSGQIEPRVFIFNLRSPESGIEPTAGRQCAKMTRFGGAWHQNPVWDDPPTGFCSPAPAAV